MDRPSNWISAVVTLICGAMVGLLTTVAHRATASIGEWSAPVGLVVGTIAVLALVGACRLLWETRLPVVAAGLGFLVAMGVLASLSGSAVFYGDAGFDDVDAVWTFVPAVLVIAVVVWPARRRRAAAGADRIEGPVHVHSGDR